MTIQRSRNNLTHTDTYKHTNTHTQNWHTVRPCSTSSTCKNSSQSMEFNFFFQTPCKFWPKKRKKGGTPNQPLKLWPLMTVRLELDWFTMNWFYPILKLSTLNRCWFCKVDDIPIQIPIFSSIGITYLYQYRFLQIYQFLPIQFFLTSIDFTYYGLWCKPIIMSYQAPIWVTLYTGFNQLVIL